MKRFDQINMIPFIDIMLVLLAIVLTTASFISQGLIPVDLPKAEQGEQAGGDEKSLEIAINAQNQIFFDGELVIAEALAGKLAPHAAHAADTPILLRVDKAAAFESFIRVVDVLKAGHFDRLAIQTEQAQ
ncbi:TonB system transport protein ExbD [Candidatus Thiothrix sp. Deng01]|uniref:Biopolymer transport protein ExbD n=1 Tax=Candidatus Thiothrix phosphatis TaxID=3112415 RepID=A0ABU6CVF1_9GAMM|nr:TonB system transport protein ExbD [Candidatus Thiothrix sp. Deng01]MEB4590378.1 TonB system transport protein ExbD [Candidatus Thiothrix sp. Deng01]